MGISLVLIALLTALGAPSPAAHAEVYSCPHGTGERYLERPINSDCHPLDIPTPEPSSQILDLSGRRHYNDWPTSPPDTQDRICRLYGEWITLVEKRPGLTVSEIERKTNLEVIFLGRPVPNCEGR